MGKIRMKQITNQSGFSLTEMAVGLGLVAVVMMSLMTVMNIMSKRQGEIENSSWAYDLRFEVTNAINNKTAFDTYTMGANPNLSCISSDTDCTGQGGPIRIMDISGAPIRLVATPGNPTQGITRRGDVCNTYGTSPDCPFRYEASWTPICASGGGCKDPQVQINTQLLVSPVAGNIGTFRPDNFNLRVNRVEKGTMDVAKICGSLGGYMSGAKCIMKIQNPCADPARPYLIGYTSDGTPRCAFEATNKRCPAGGVLTAINSNGTYDCMNGCSGGGAQSGVNFDFTD